MGIEYYAFSLFISGLICLIAIICKVLFANVRRQFKLLDEKETKLLQLYQTVESIMEDFQDQAKAATEEIRDYENRAALLTASLVPPLQDNQKKQAGNISALYAQQQGEYPYISSERLPHTERINPSRYKAVKEALSMTEKIAKDDASKSASVSAKNDNLAVFQRFFDETAMQALPNVEEVANKPTRNESILALAEEGKTDAQIASELGITQNEVRLIIGLTVRK